MTTYPFQRSKPTGWAYGEILTSAQMNIVDDNASQAADGAVWTDTALVRNWMEPQNMGFGSLMLTGVWSATYRRWWVFVSAAAAQFAPGGLSGDWLINSPAAGVTPARNAVAANGGIVLVGGDGGASASKIRRCVETSTGGTWSSVNMVDATAATCNCLAYFSAGSKWIAGLSNGNIETSADGTSGSWTNRTVPNATTRSRIACSSSKAVVIPITATDKAIYSSDGITWAESTLPSSSTWLSVAHSTVRDAFLAVGAAGVIAKSADGITWSTSGITAPASNELAQVVSLGRLWVILEDDGGGTRTRLWVSADNAATWYAVRSANNNGVASKWLQSSGTQLAFSRGYDATNDRLYISFGGGL